MAADCPWCGTTLLSTEALVRHGVAAHLDEILLSHIRRGEQSLGQEAPPKRRRRLLLLREDEQRTGEAAALLREVHRPEAAERLLDLARKGGEDAVAELRRLALTQRPHLEREMEALAVPGRPWDPRAATDYGPYLRWLLICEEARGVSGAVREFIRRARLALDVAGVLFLRDFMYADDVVGGWTYAVLMQQEAALPAWPSVQRNIVEISRSFIRLVRVDVERASFFLRRIGREVDRVAKITRGLRYGVDFKCPKLADDLLRLLPATSCAAIFLDHFDDLLHAPVFVDLYDESRLPHQELLEHVFKVDGRWRFEILRHVVLEQSHVMPAVRLRALVEYMPGAWCDATTRLHGGPNSGVAVRNAVDPLDVIDTYGLTLTDDVFAFAAGDAHRRMSIAKLATPMAESLEAFRDLDQRARVARLLNEIIRRHALKDQNSLALEESDHPLLPYRALSAILTDPAAKTSSKEWAALCLWNLQWCAGTYEFELQCPGPWGAGSATYNHALDSHAIVPLVAAIASEDLGADEMVRRLKCLQKIARCDAAGGPAALSTLLALALKSRGSTASEAVRLPLELLQKRLRPPFRRALAG
jgi:hypothetical protein